MPLDDLFERVPDDLRTRSEPARPNRRRWQRHPFVWTAVGALGLMTVFAGATVRNILADRCFPDISPPFAPRAHAQRSRIMTNEGTTTFAKMMKFYGVTLPKDASGIRYYSDDTVWNASPELYLRFSVPEHQVEPFLVTLGAVTSYEGTAATWPSPSPSRPTASTGPSAPARTTPSTPSGQPR